MQEFADHRRHSTKMPWPRCAFEDAAEGFYLYHRGCPGRVYLLHHRRENHLDLRRLKQPEVSVQVTGVVLEVLVWTKLRGIDKNARDHAVVLSSRSADQG